MTGYIIAALIAPYCLIMQWYSVNLRLLQFEFQKSLQLTTAQYNYGYPADVEEDDITWIDTLKTRTETLTLQNELHFFNVFPFFNYDHARTESSQIAGRWVVNTDAFAVRGLNDPILRCYEVRFLGLCGIILTTAPRIRRSTHDIKNGLTIRSKRSSSSKKKEIFEKKVPP